MKTGLLGGSFDPPHFGHLQISKDALETLNLDKIWWLLTKQNPLKSSQSSDFAKRLALCEEITKNDPKIIPKDIEKHLKSTYLIDLLNNITKNNPKEEFILLIGSDNLINFHLWYKWKEILNLVKIVVFNRKNYKKEAKNSKTALFCQKLYKNDQKERLIFINNEYYDISSTQIRKQNENKI